MSDFQQRIKARNEQFVMRATKAKRGAALKMMGEVVLNTIVDTGRARGNWQVSNARPATGTLERDDRSGAGTIRNGSSTIAENKLTEDLWISNNLPYIYRLAYEGWSKRISANWFRAIIDRWRATLSAAWRANDGER